MSDLISRSALLDDMQKELEKAVNNEDMTEFDCKVLMTSALALKNFVSRQPTAYDVEKVVAELEEEREYSYADFEEYVQEKSPCLDSEYDDYFHRGLERAVVIVKRGVKRGGVE